MVGDCGCSSIIASIFLVGWVARGKMCERFDKSGYKIVVNGSGLEEYSVISW